MMAYLMLTFNSPGMICTDETELVAVTAVFALMSTKTCILDADLIMKCKIWKVFGFAIYVSSMVLNS